jgi:AcrR family transcriptional regulator
MPQVLKEEVRRRILRAALQAFAAEGYQRTTMAAVAARAGLGAASLYRYYPGKEALFDAAVPRAVADGLMAILRRRVAALASAVGAGGGAAALAGADDGGEAILRFWIDHRLEVVILLDRADGTPYAGFGDRFVETLLAMTLQSLRARRAGVPPGSPGHLVLRQVFLNTRRALNAILEAGGEEADIREAIEAFWSYQLAGLAALTARLGGGRCARRPASGALTGTRGSR